MMSLLPLSKENNNSDSKTDKSIFDRYDLIIRIVGSLLAAHFVETLGREDSFLKMMTYSYYYVDVISGAFIAFTAWTVLSYSNRYLNKTISWDANFYKRLIAQLILGVFIPTIIVHFGTYLQSITIIPDSSFNYTWLNSELPACILIILLANTVYFIFHLYDKLQLQTVAVLHNNESTKANTDIEDNSEACIDNIKKIILVNKGRKFIPLPTESISYILRKSNMNYIKTFDDDTFITTNTLDELYLVLDKRKFFKANRQIIFNMYACSCYTPIENGKIEVTLKPISEEPIIISQKTAPVFKEWIDQ